MKRNQAHYIGISQCNNFDIFNKHKFGLKHENCCHQFIVVVLVCFQFQIVVLDMPNV